MTSQRLERMMERAKELNGLLEDEISIGMCLLVVVADDQTRSMAEIANCLYRLAEK